MSYEDWNTADVIKQLRALGFGQYCREFQMNEIVGRHLPLLTEDHLKEMGVASVGDRILMLRRFSDIASGKFTPPPPREPPAAAPDPEPWKRADPVRNIPKRNELPPEPAPAKTVPPPPPAKQAPPPGRKPPMQRDWSDSSNQMSGSDKPPAPPPPAKKVPPPPEPAPAQKAPPPPPPKKVPPPPHPAPAQKAPPPPPAKKEPPPGRKQPIQRDWSDSSSQMSGSDKPAQRQQAKADVMPSHKPHETYVKHSAADGHITCQYCGGRFPPDAAKRHIPVCGRFNGGKTGKK
jgi:hypothetical protein